MLQMSLRGLSFAGTLFLLSLPGNWAYGNPERLTPGDTKERELAEGESHSYLLELGQDRYLYLYAVQKKVDVRLVLRDPSGQEIQNVDDQFLRGHRPENLVWISEQAGDYLLVVESVAGQGRYRLVWNAEWDIEATEDLRRRTPADRLYYRALGLQGRPEHKHCRSAIEILTQTLDTWEELGDVVQEASVLNNIGYCLNRLGEYEDAAEFLTRALQKMPESVDSKRAQSLQNLAFSQRHAGRFEEAVENYREVISIHHLLGRKLDEGKGLLGLGSTLREEGALETALNYFYQARELFEEVEAGQYLASALNSIATALTHLGRVDEALTLLEEAGQLADPDDRMGALVRAALAANQGSIYDWIGEPTLALKHFELSIEQNLALGNRLGEARARRQLGILYRDLGELEAALDELGRCAGLQGSLGRTRDVAEIRVLVADTYRRRGDLEIALAIVDLALPVLAEVGSVTNRVEALEKKGLILEDLGRSREAGEVYRQALGALAKVQDQGREGRLQAAAGANALHGSNARQAEEYLRAALALSRTSRDHETEVESLLNLARLESKKGKLDSASRHVDEALEVIERVRNRVGGERFRISYLERQWEAYALGIDLLARRHRQDPNKKYDRRAFLLSERMQARVLQDLALVSRKEMRVGVDEELLEQERRLRHQLNAREHFLLHGSRMSEDHRRRVAKEIGLILRRLRDTEARIFRESPAFGQTRPAELMSVAQIQRELLTEDTLFLEFFLGEERSLVWAMTQDEFRMEELPAGEELEAMALELRRLLTLPGEQPAQQTFEERRAWAEEVEESERLYVELGIRLSEALLGPVRDFLDGRRLLVVPDGALRLLPFGALPEPGSEVRTWQPLMVQRAVLSAPSASAVGALRRQRTARPKPDRLLAVFADPVMNHDDPRLDAEPSKDGETVAEHPAQARTAATLGRVPELLPTVSDLTPLPYSREEAESLLRLGEGRGKTMPALGFEASRAKVLEADLRRYQYLVFSTHALVEDRWPELSGIVLSTFDSRGRPLPGFLALHDIYDLELSADLVVLSACETAVGKSVRGEGLLSLTRGFLHAGAARVLASLWRVEDQATARLMEQVNRRILVQGLAPEEALREAMKAFREDPHSPRYGHPYFWAGFVVMGDWR